MFINQLKSCFTPLPKPQPGPCDPGSKALVLCVKPEGWAEKFDRYQPSDRDRAF